MSLDNSVEDIDDRIRLYLKKISESAIKKDGQIGMICKENILFFAKAVVYEPANEVR